MPVTVTRMCQTQGGKCLQALFFTYGGMEEGTAAVMAEMLGFNPDLVMPQLQQELEANIKK